MNRVICFGEILWDLLPRGRFLGGAPLNVAYHLNRLGHPAVLASSVGRDELGDAALAAVAASGGDVRLLGRHATLPTGTAVVQLDARGQASFHLPAPVAWDEIDVADLTCGPAPDAVVFGTLALRGTANRDALTRLLDAFPQAWVVCDLNLRPPSDELAPLQPILSRAQLVKLNGDEARRLTGRPGAADDWQGMAAELSGRHHGAPVCITLGGDGAGLFAAGRWYRTTAPAVTVRDTVGAGDAFTAALVAGKLRSSTPDWERILRAASSLGSFVASRDGAQPDYGDFRIKW